MSDDLISRQATINALEELKELDYELYIRTSYSHLMEDQWDFVIKRYKEAIKETPCAQQKTGRWEPLFGTIGKVFKCSECGAVVTVAYECFKDGCYYDYCPNCGAKMEGETE